MKPKREQKKEIALDFGALTPPLSDQLQLQGLRLDSKSFLRCFQKDADGITRLEIRGLMTDGEVYKARQRLLAVISRRVKLVEVTK